MKNLILAISILFLSVQTFAQAPIISVTPDSLSEDLLSGKSSNQILTIFNNGESDLSFEINVKENLESSLILSDRLINDNYYINESNQTSESISSDISNSKSYSDNYIPLKESLNKFNNGSTDLNKYLLGGLKILLITSAGVPPDEIKNALLTFSDIQTVDVYDASSSTPNLNQLLPYNSVIIMNDSPYSDPVALGNVLADYVDAGRGLIMTIATFASGWEVQGRLFNENYFPFNVGYGPVGSASLGTFNQNHPIMQGVTNAYSDLLVEVTLADSAELVANWNNGLPFVATKGRNVAAVNAFVTTPDGWKWVKLGEVVDSVRYGTSKKCYYEKVGKPVLRIPNIINGYINDDDLKYSKFKKDEISELSLNENDILIIRSNGSLSIVGKTAIVSDKHKGYLYAGYLIRIRLKAESYNSKFLNLLFSSNQLRNQIEFKAKSTSGVNNINAQEIQALDIPLPPLTQQTQIVEEIEKRFSDADNLEKAIDDSLEKSEALRQSILKQAFEGKLV